MLRAFSGKPVRFTLEMGRVFAGQSLHTHYPLAGDIRGQGWQRKSIRQLVCLLTVTRIQKIGVSATQY